MGSSVSTVVIVKLEQDMLEAFVARWNAANIRREDEPNIVTKLEVSYVEGTNEAVIYSLEEWHDND